MLVRSAGRRQQRQTARLLSDGFAQLTLPWLAPAQLRWSATHTEPSHASDRSRRRSPSHSPHGAAQTRRLATATDTYTPRASLQYPEARPGSTFRNQLQDVNVPWDVNQSLQARFLSGVQTSTPPIVLDFMQQGPNPTIKVIHGVQGTAQDLLKHFHIALQVKRFGRAETIIQRLSVLFAPDSLEMVHAHTAYLETSLVALSLYGRGLQSTHVLRAMQRWFEVEVRARGVPLDAKMLVTMIRASIKALAGKESSRTIKRYLAIARDKGSELYDEVLDSDEYDDSEFILLGRHSAEVLEEQEMKANESVDAGEVLLAELPPEDLTVPRGESTRPDKGDRMGTVRMDDIPAVLETPQQGEGLAGVKRSLLDFAQVPDLPSDATFEQKRQHAYNRQRLMEVASVEVAIDRWHKADEELRKIGINTVMQTKPINALMWQWYEALLPALKEELEACKKVLSKPGVSDHDRHHYGPYLELLPLDKIAVTTILSTLSRLAGTDRVQNKKTLEIKLPSLTMGLAKAIEQECSVNAEKQKSVKRSRSRNRSLKARAKRTKDAKKMSKDQELLASLTWPADTMAKFGAMLTSKLVETAQLPVTRPHPRTGELVTQLQPAFLHRHRWQSGRKVGLISPNPALVTKLESEPIGSLIAKRMPMVVEPQPWTGWDEGGYLHYSNAIMRLPTSEVTSKEYFKAAHLKGDMHQIYAGLNTLGEVPWKIQQDVFKVQLEAWNSGEAFGSLAPLNPKFNLPPEPDASASHLERKKWLEELRDIENKKIGLHSERCFQNFQVEIARTMLNETLYFPHSIDFRGRAYPIPPYLNHMGADNVRGLLVFGQGKKLGATGLRWLKIHVATVAGYDKASLSERLEFTMNHLDDIYDSVRNPLGGRRWWLEAEDCWQTLSACFELTKALDSPDPENFVSHLPIQQDGTCNGLQHYAALGGDEIGAAQVNLQPGDRPADVYTAVAEAVKAEVHEDALKGNPIALKLDGHLTRKCVKQPVMTNVYGVTWFGAKEQVKKQLEIIFPDVRKFEAVNHHNMSQYVAMKIFKSLGTMFGGAQSIQHWLGQCADRISTALTPEQIEAASKPATDKMDNIKKVGRPKRANKQAAAAGTSKGDQDSKEIAKLMFRSTVIWTTPLRLPVVQPYRSGGHRQVKTSMQLISLQEPRSWHPVSKRKQLQAFPPNFIHSLDASHMMLSALRCRELGMTFASVHDSFWTHACDVDRLSIALRDSFVEMHSDNIVGRLREEFETRYRGYMYFASIQSTSAVGRKIIALRKAQNIKASDELAMEAKRLRLLRSEDVRERKAGEAMVTPGGLLAAEKGNDQGSDTLEELRSQQLGSIPKNADAEPSSGADAANDSLGETERDISELTGEAGEGVVSGSALDMDVDVMQTAAVPLGGTTGSAQPKRKKSSSVRKVHVWMPLTFPEVPPKGKFDVQKIRESNYFFH